jgi:hypothetical protein
MHSMHGIPRMMMQRDNSWRIAGVIIVGLFVALLVYVIGGAPS